MCLVLLASAILHLPIMTCMPPPTSACLEHARGHSCEPLASTHSTRQQAMCRLENNRVKQGLFGLCERPVLAVCTVLCVGQLAQRVRSGILLYSCAHTSVIRARDSRLAAMPLRNSSLRQLQQGRNGATVRRLRSSVAHGSPSICGRPMLPCALRCGARFRESVLRYASSRSTERVHSYS